MFSEKISASFFNIPLFTSTNEIQSVCQNFFTETGITYFNYIKRYNDGTKLSLSNRADWHRYYYEKELFKNILEIEKKTLIEKTYIGNVSVVLWNNEPDDKIVKLQRVNFNISNGISVAIVYENFAEYCYFGAKNENTKISNWYINNIGDLIRFIHYFKNGAKNIIKKASLPQNLITYHNNIKQPNKQWKLFEYNKIKKSCNRPKYYFLYINDNEILITSREMDCIMYMAMGYSSSEIGDLLAISERTVEKHVENIKSKLICNRKSDLIDIFLKNGLFNLLVKNIIN